MSTRSVIARPKGDGWEGAYQHHDGYPSGMGARLWASLHQGHDPFTGRLAEQFPDAAALTAFYLAQVEETIDDQDVPEMIEWVYVLGGHTLTVLARTLTSELRELRGPDRTILTHGSTHRLLAQFDLRDAEPDWRMLEAQQRLLNDAVLDLRGCPCHLHGGR